MDSENPFYTPISNLDYLNQIAPPEKPKNNKVMKIALLVGIPIVFLLIIVFVTTLSRPTSSAPSATRVSARLQKLETISTAYSSKLKTPALQDLNSSLRSVLITSNRSLNTYLSSSLPDYKKKAKTIPALDSPTEITNILDEAYLNSALDDKYMIEMSFQIEDTLVMMKRLQATTKSKAFKEILDQIVSDFENIQKRFDKLNGANSSN